MPRGVRIFELSAGFADATIFLLAEIYHESRNRNVLILRRVIIFLL